MLGPLNSTGTFLLMQLFGDIFDYVCINLIGVGQTQSWHTLQQT